jgi:hypothetical protein
LTKTLLTSTIVVESALGLITDSLSKIRPDILPVASTNDEDKTVNTTVQAEIHDEFLSPESNHTGHRQGYLEHPEAVTCGSDPEEFTISDETLEAFPFLTPIDAAFGTSYDQDY